VSALPDPVRLSASKINDQRRYSTGTDMSVKRKERALKCGGRTRLRSATARQGAEGAPVRQARSRHRSGSGAAVG
jgi:hypothetical protein